MMNAERLLKGGIVLLGICAATVASVAGRELGGLGQPDRFPRHVADWGSYREAGLGRDSLVHSVNVVAFIDYECPFSRILAKELGTIQELFDSQVGVTFRQFPLQGHEHAFPAALAAECADQQGMFMPFHKVLLASDDIVRTGAWGTAAVRSGIRDTLQFTECLTSASARAAVVADTMAGHRLGIDGTPMFLVNDQFYSGVPNDLEGILRRALQSVQHASRGL